MSLLGGLGVSPQRIFQFGGSETLFSALVMRYVSKTSTLNKCEKVDVFSGYNIISEVLLIYPRTSTLNISQYCVTFG